MGLEKHAASLHNCRLPSGHQALKAASHSQLAVCPPASVNRETAPLRFEVWLPSIRACGGWWIAWQQQQQQQQQQQLRGCFVMGFVLGVSTASRPLAANSCEGGGGWRGSWLTAGRESVGSVMGLKGLWRRDVLVSMQLDSALACWLRCSSPAANSRCGVRQPAPAWRRDTGCATTSASTPTLVMVGPC